MSTKLKYVPILRGRLHEIEVLKSFNFGNRIYPCLEIIKELDRLPPKPRKAKKAPKKAKKPKPEKKFEDVYIPIINSIKAERVFIDLPVHLKPAKKMKPEILLFLRSVLTKRDVRTEYVKKLAVLSSKVIPVISSYYDITNERGTLKLQEADLRKHFPSLAFRTFFDSFFRDLDQLKNILRKEDYLIMDWEDQTLDLENDDQLDIIYELEQLDCTIICHRNSICSELTNVGLEHGKLVTTIDNSLLNKFQSFGAKCFSDYAGIKKDEVTDGGMISPGFVYYDAVQNSFYGYRFLEGSHKKGETKPKLSEFETTIVPSVIASRATQRMRKHSTPYLGAENKGWQIIKNIELGSANGGESGQSAGKFKRIGLEHYLHCIKVKIANGDFD